MAQFGAKEFITKLKELNIPEAEKLNVQSIDWIFYDKKLKYVANFLEWLSQTVNYEDLLTNEELTIYNEMFENGSLLPAEFLDDINECLNSADFDHGERQLSPEIHDEEATEKELKRKNQLCLQKMELQEEINKQQKTNDMLEAEIQETLTSLDNQANIHIKTVENLCTSVDAAIDNLGKFRKQSKNATSYISQLDLCQWQKQEDNCRISIQTYIDKEFKQGETLSLEDSSSYYLLDSGKIDIELVKSRNIEVYKNNVTELNRLSKMIELSEIRLIEANLEKTKFEAHINEMEIILKPSAIPPRAGILIEQRSQLAVEKQAVEEHFEMQLNETLTDAKAVSALERCKTISGDYKAKLQRQENYLNKQVFVTDSLLEQLSRYDFVRICLETEKKELSQIVKFVGDLNTFFIDKCKLSSDRHEILQNKEVMTGNDYEYIFENLNYQVNYSDACYQLNDKLNETNTLKQSYLDKMQALCGAFEKCLFTNGKSSLKSLPSSWLPSDLIDKSEKLENDLWSFQQEMVNTIKALETKKKILAVNPDVYTEMFQWTKKN